MAGDPAQLLVVDRGPAVEQVVRGHVALVDGDGTLLAGAGDVDLAFPVRSTVKPLQALAFAESGAHDACPDPDAALAIACGSHGGEPVHVDAVRSILGAWKLDEAQLECGATFPLDRKAAADVRAAGLTPQPILHNCSGKHAAVMATCAARGWPVADYRLPEHPAQQNVVRAWREHAGTDVAAAPVAVDGCGLPTLCLSARALATAFAAATARSAPFQRILDAMTAHPVLVGGTRRFDTAVMQALAPDHHVVCKSGAAATWTALSRDQGWALAIKLEAGETSSLLYHLAATLLSQLLGTASVPPSLDRYLDPLVRNSRGEPVGQIRATVTIA